MKVGNTVKFKTNLGLTLTGIVERIVTVEGPFKPHTDDISKWLVHVNVEERYTDQFGHVGGTYQVKYLDCRVDTTK